MQTAKKILLLLESLVLGKTCPLLFLTIFNRGLQDRLTSTASHLFEIRIFQRIEQKHHLDLRCPLA
jgi:hypothetical protein